MLVLPLFINTCSDVMLEIESSVSKCVLVLISARICDHNVLIHNQGSWLRLITSLYSNLKVIAVPVLATILYVAHLMH